MIYELIYSATGRTEKVLDIISEEWQGEKTRIDLSAVDFNANHIITEKDFCIIATSVVEGRVPAPALNNLKKLSGNGAKALLLAVYGNRAVDDYFLEMKTESEQLGFVPIAAIQAVTQHSIVKKVAADRPDRDDIAEVKSYVTEVKKLLKKDVIGQLNVPGNFPYSVRGDAPLKPKSNHKCTNCGICAARCPVQAIDKYDPNKTDYEKCIVCMRCVEDCPVKARTVSKFMTWAVYMVIKDKVSGRKPNRLYLAE